MKEIVSRQREYFNQGKTLGADARKTALKQLMSALQQNQQKLIEALYQDFRKSEFETRGTELNVIYQEIDLALKKLDSWMRWRKVKTDTINRPGKSVRIPEPYGVSLVIGTWNYPYNLSIVPAVSAIAAGNTVVIKPSEVAPNASRALAEALNSSFDAGLLKVVEGGADTATQLLDERWDKILYTGSTRVGRIVAEKAARHLTPVTLELGGKTPVLVLPDADLEVAAKRIVWGKFLNAGQTCIAPDYVLVHERVENELLESMRVAIEKFYGDPRKSEAYLRIVDQRHFETLKNLIDRSKLFLGGETDASDRYISPTLLRDVRFADPIMQDEIFGPIMPTIRYSNLEEAKGWIRSLPKPLALYVFTNDRDAQKDVLTTLSFGGGAVNDTIMHCANPYLPFGGVGESGSGAYHGEAGFNAFSHFKSVIIKSTWFDLPLRYPPYTDSKKRLLSRILMT